MELQNLKRGMWKCAFVFVYISSDIDIKGRYKVARPSDESSLGLRIWLGQHY